MEAAHQKAITHRDLKPANILSTKSGIKVLDFGLAKTESAKPLPDDATVTNALTQEGAIVGTLQYMAPEQLNGKEVDPRADIFSFGCVFYDMLTGKRAFEGATAASVIAAILEREAPSVKEVASAALDRLLKKCLAKDPADRWQTARDLKDELEWIASGGGPEVPPQAKPRATSLWGWGAALLFAIALGALAFIGFREKPQETPMARFAIRAPENTVFLISPGAATVDLALSPDGRKLVFRAVSQGNGRLWIRSVDALEALPLAGTEVAYRAFWSPDGKAIGFAANGKLKRIDLAGGPVVSLADIGTGIGFSGSWSSEGTILFSRGEPRLDGR